MVDLSIIVPVYNVEEFLVECVESIIKNDYENKEIILVDDGSTDSSSSICESYAQKYDYIKVLHKKNGGLSSARNYGIDFAQGKYLGFVDSDDIIAHDMYSEMMNHAKLHNADMVVCGIYNYYGDDKEKTIAVHSKNTVVYEDNKKYSLFIDHNGMGDYAVNKIYLKSLFDTVRFPEGKSFEDIYTSYKLYEKAKKVVCLDKDLYYYRYRLNSISRSSKYNPNMINIVLSVKEQYEFIKKNALEYISQAGQKFLDANMIFLNHIYSNNMIRKEKKLVKMLRDNVNILLNEECEYDRFYHEAKMFGHVDADLLYKPTEKYETNGNKVIIYAGNIKKLYGIQNLVEGFIKANIPDAELRVFGDGDYRKELELITKSHTNVKYMGVRPNEEVVNDELRASLLVNPRPIEPEYTKYSFPSKNMEYMVSGTPVLTTKLPGMPKEYYPYVYLIEKETPDGIAQTLKNIFEEPLTERYNKGEAARRFVLENKSNIQQAGKIIKFLKSEVCLDK